ncbi:hypothetical protein HanRHA438_Chr02g0089301 [Helianthus annuus]|nr:hypothetical protein HanIR_Chr02g0090851 [Helianthus annuus]KAJ0940965.1 hypothetical protein HanRHA438_Chr02g0089301 [Helianthus annuus]
MIRLCMGQDMVVLMFKMEVELGTTVAYGTVSYGGFCSLSGHRKAATLHRKGFMATVSYGSHRSLRWSCRAPRNSKLWLTRPARDRAVGFLLKL